MFKKSKTNRLRQQQPQPQVRQQQPQQQVSQPQVKQTAQPTKSVNISSKITPMSLKTELKLIKEGEIVIIIMLAKSNKYYCSTNVNANNAKKKYI